MVVSSFKFLLKEKDLKMVLNLSPSQDFFPYHKINTFFKNQHTQHPMSSQCFLQLSPVADRKWLHTCYSSLF